MATEGLHKLFIFIAKMHTSPRTPLPPHLSEPPPSAPRGVFLFNFYFLLESDNITRMFISFPYEPRKLQATEGRLKAIMKAARLGLKGDRLAIAAGMMPTKSPPVLSIHEPALYGLLAGYDPSQTPVPLHL